MLNSSLIIIPFVLLPALFIYRLCYLSQNERFCSLVNYINDKMGKFFLNATFCCALYAFYLSNTNQTDLILNPFSIGFVYFLVLTASNLRVYDGFGILFMLFGNGIVFAAFARELFNSGGLYYVLIFSAVYCIYSLIFTNLHHITKFLNIKIGEGK